MPTSRSLNNTDMTALAELRVGQIAQDSGFSMQVKEM